MVAGLIATQIATQAISMPQYFGTGGNSQWYCAYGSCPKKVKRGSDFCRKHTRWYKKGKIA